MAGCLHPLLAEWCSPALASDLKMRESGNRPRIIDEYHEKYKRLLTSWSEYGDARRFILLPCGKCFNCVANHAREWAFRCSIERDFSIVSSFITLTVEDSKMETVFPGRNLCYKPFQDFMKRLRGRVGVVRFLMCGEYGDKFDRPHYHALIFGYGFPDRYVWKVVDGHIIYRSSLLEDCWKDGFSTVEDCTDGSIQYVCRYVMKKLLPDYQDVQVPPFIRMSLKPGIGYQYFRYFGEDFLKKGLDGIYYNDYVTYVDKKIPVPRFYLKMFEKRNNVDFVSYNQQKFLRDYDPFSTSDHDLRREMEYRREVTKGRIIFGERIYGKENQ